jgi:putative SOS response-associated peptidase YedK
MCGRYTLSTPVGRLAEEFGFDGSGVELSPSYNVAPGTEVPTVLLDGGERRLEMLKWGLVPSWADDPGIGSRMINARSETAPEKPSFRRAFRSRRCLIPADGFYEWKRERGGKQPFFFRMTDGSPFAFAGLWESWEGDGMGPIRSCTILTTAPNRVVGEVHNRMPVILPPDAYDAWLGSEAEKEELVSLLAPYPDDAMEAYPVSRAVNSPRNDGPGCIEPAA